MTCEGAAAGVALKELTTHVRDPSGRRFVDRRVSHSQQIFCAPGVGPHWLSNDEWVACIWEE